MTMPDFKEWVRSLMSLPPHSNHPSSIEQALKDAFEQGYNVGLNQGWAIEQDKDSSVILKKEGLCLLDCNCEYNPDLDFTYCSKCGQTG